MPASPVALIYPPTCDPTAPYLSVPMLTGFLRSEGVEVLPIDANVEAFDALLSPEPLAAVRDRLEARLTQLEGQKTLSHEGQLELGALARARGDAHAVPHGIDEAKAILRDEARFFDAGQYASAVATVDAALRAISAAYHPLHLDFTAYRTPLGLASAEEIERESHAEHDPFHAWTEQVLIPRLRAANVSLVGLSVCFPGQLQPAYSMAHAIKRALPHVHLTCGGPGITQMMVRLRGQRLARALGPFDSAVLYEGERTLLALARALQAGGSLRHLENVVLRDKLMGARALAGHGMGDLRGLVAPDFRGLALEKYLSPTLVLPYDPTRGCYWGKCTFCHYGLAEVGTASYRERGVASVVEQLAALSSTHGTKHFYFSQDSVAPKTLVQLAQALADSGLGLRWATDLKPEKYLTAERAAVLSKGGAVACALGVESGSPRVLSLIDKGAPIEVVGDVIERLAGAGIAAEAMCFTDFPTETHAEAVQTLSFLAQRRDEIGVYIVGEFGLTHGSLVAQEPSQFDIEETWELAGDDLGLGIFYAPRTPWKSDDERAVESDKLAELSSGWALRPYPWAGAVSTAHSILHYDRFGAGAFRDEARRAVRGSILGARTVEAAIPFDLGAAVRAEERDAGIWALLVNEERTIGREPYESLAAEQPRLRKRTPVMLAFRAGELPALVGAPPGKKPAGRRPSHAVNATRG